MAEMSRRYYLFAVIFIFLFLLICGAQSVFALTSTNAVTHTAEETSATDTVEIFKIDDNIKEIKKTNGDAENKDITVKTFYSPFIVAADDVIIALAEVNYTGKDDSDSSAEKTELLTKYIEMKKEGKTNNWVENIMKKEGTNNKWKAQFATNNWQKAFVISALKNNTADAKTEKKNIYFIAINGTSTVPDSQNLQYDFMIVNGTISSDKGENKIRWCSKNVTTASFWKDFKSKFVDKLSETPSFVGSAVFVPEKNKFVFAVTGKDKDGGSSNKYISALIEIKENMGELKLLNVTDISDGCYPYFLPWEGKIIMIPTICGDNTNTVIKEFNDGGDKKEWEKHGGPLSRLMKYLSDKRDFTTVSIDNHNAILFTEHKTKETKKYDVNLWVSDGKRLKSVGSITSSVDSVTHMDFLYTSGELFSLHNQSKGSDNKNILTQLKQQKTAIKDVLDAWKKSDTKVSKLCGTELTTVKDPCSNNMSTEGIVGWLSDGGEDSTKWKNEYLYVNATVTEGTKVDNGFKFDNIGAGAKWPMGKITDDQPYNFTDSGFTLVATVTIDSVGKDNSVLSVGVEDNDKKNNIFGLLCAKEGKWSVISNKGQTAATKNLSCEQGKSYKVTLTLKNNENGEGTVYVDGQKLSASGNDFKIKKGSENSFYFYFGAGVNGGQSNDAESHVTVTNVLLYNRPFTENEVEKLKIVKQEKPKERSEKPANHTDGQERTQGDRETTGGSSGGNGDGSDTTDKDTKITDMTSSSQPEDSTVRGGVGGALLTLLLLFLSDLCVHALFDR